MSFDRNDPADLAELKAEATNDPDAIGYTVLTDGDTNKFLGEINTKGGYTVEKPKISAAAVRSATTFDAYDGLLNPEQQWLQWLTGSNGFDEENLDVNDEIKQKFAGIPTANQSIWATGERTEMNAAMSALINVPASRAEDLWGYNTTISRDDWFAARDS